MAEVLKSSPDNIPEVLKPHTERDVRAVTLVEQVGEEKGYGAALKAFVELFAAEGEKPAAIPAEYALLNIAVDYGESAAATTIALRLTDDLAQLDQNQNVLRTNF